MNKTAPLPDHYDSLITEQWDIVLTSLEVIEDRKILNSGISLDYVASLYDENSPWKDLPVAHYAAGLQFLFGLMKIEGKEAFIPLFAAACWHDFEQQHIKSNLIASDVYLNCLQVIDQYGKFDANAEQHAALLRQIPQEQTGKIEECLLDLYTAGLHWEHMPRTFPHLHTQPYSDEQNMIVKLGEAVDLDLDNNMRLEKKTAIRQQAQKSSQQISAYLEGCLVHHKSISDRVAVNICRLIAFLEEDGHPLPRIGKQQRRSIIEQVRKLTTNATELQEVGLSKLSQETLSMDIQTKAQGSTQATRNPRAM